MLREVKDVYSTEQGGLRYELRIDRSLKRYSVYRAKAGSAMPVKPLYSGPITDEYFNKITNGSTLNTGAVYLNKVIQAIDIKARPKDLAAIFTLYEQAKADIDNKICIN